MATTGSGTGIRQTGRGFLRQEPAVLVSLLMIVVSLLAGIAIFDVVRDRKTQAVDEQVLLALRHPADRAQPIGPPWVAKGARDVSALGSQVVLILAVGSVAGFLHLTRKRQAMWLLLVATIGGGLLVLGLKDYVDRPRPLLVPHLDYVNSPSFPSGHSALAAVVYLTLGSLLASITFPLRTKLYILAVSVVITLLVGLSRVLLGVHYPTDVLAGWAFGLSWSLLCWLAARYLQRRGALGRPPGALRCRSGHDGKAGIPDRV